MRKLYIAALIALTVGCSNPKDIVFGPKPLEQIAEQGELFRKLPEEDRKLLVGYLSMHEMGKAFGGNIEPVTGKTVAEVLTEARAWKARMAAAEAEENARQKEAEALKQKVLAERKAISERISSSVIVAVVGKTVLPEDFRAGRYSEMLSLKYAIQNKSQSIIRQLKGKITFKDATGDEIGWLSVDFDEPINPGQTLTTTTGRGWKLNQFSNGEIERIAAREFSSMTASFEPESIAFDNGEVIKSPDIE